MASSAQVLYEEDMARIEEELSGLLRESDGKCVLLVDRDGHMIASKGFTRSIDIAALSALTAGSVASTREIARLVGEQEFTVLFHEGKKDNIHMSLVDERAIMVVIFDDRTTIGMVRLCARSTSQNLARIFDEASKRPGRVPPSVTEGLGAAAEQKLEQMFEEK